MKSPSFTCPHCGKATEMCAKADNDRFRCQCTECEASWMSDSQGNVLPPPNNATPPGQRLRPGQRYPTPVFASMATRSTLKSITESYASAIPAGGSQAVDQEQRGSPVHQAAIPRMDYSKRLKALRARRGEDLGECPRCGSDQFVDGHACPDCNYGGDAPTTDYGTAPKELAIPGGRYPRARRVAAHDFIPASTGESQNKTMNNIPEEAKLGTGARFAALKGKLSHNPKVHNPGALAAAIGRKKYGKGKFQKMAAAGRRHHSMVPEQPHYAMMSTGESKVVEQQAATLVGEVLAAKRKEAVKPAAAAPAPAK